jgi:hypothetical protein
MKKIIGILVGIVLCSSLSYGQESSFGVKAGLNSFTFSESQFKSRTSFHFGGYYNYMISDKFAIQPELLYSQQGAKFEFDLGFFVKASGTYAMNYLSIPVMAKYYVIEGLNLHAGPVIGILISSSFSGTTGAVSTNTLDIMLGIGAAYELSMGVNFGLRYNLGLTETISGGDGSKNRGIQVSVGYSFLQ